MSKTLTMKIDGLETVKQKMKAYVVAKKGDLEDETTKVLMDIERNAKKKAPVNKKVGAGGRLRSSIHRRQQGLNGEVYTNVHYAPYQEFGTGTLVSVPDELKEIAEQFRGDGIRQVNLPAQPFMYPAFQSGSKDYVKRIDKALGHEEI